MFIRMAFILFAVFNCCSLSANIENVDTSKKASYQYNLSICAIFRDEGPYLKEWIEFHRLVGVQHFLLYNHLSVDNFREVLQPYIDNKIVEVIDLTDEIESRSHWGSIQTGSYNDGLAKLSGVSKWVAFIDSDEFLYPVKKDNLNTVLKNYEKFGGVCAHWAMFGTSHIPKIPEKVLQIEALVYRAKLDCPTNGHVKSIVRPERVSHFPNPHYAIYKLGYGQVNENKVAFEGPINKEISSNILRINHYWTRDEDYFFNVKVPSRVKRGLSKETELKRAGNYNAELDTSMFRFVPALRAKMGYQ